MGLPIDINSTRTRRDEAPTIMQAAKPLLIITLGITAGALGILAFQPWHLINLPQRAPILQGCNRPDGYVSIILDSEGFNNSGPSFPVLLHYNVGQTVKILVCNLDRIDAHGFAIDHYFDTGITLRPGQSYEVSFVARVSGAFLIYCNVLCPIHAFMRAKLLVTE